MTLTSEQEATKLVLAHKLASLGLSARFTDPVTVGPIVSIYRFTPTGSTRVAHIEAIADDLAMALGIKGDILVKRMPGETACCIYVPNPQPEKIYWRDLCHVRRDLYEVPLILGVDQLGNKVIEDLVTLPHLLICGATGGGKSVLMRSLLASLCYNLDPTDIQFVLSDTTGVEFELFESTPHLLFPVCKTVFQTAERLEWLNTELDNRLKLFEKGGHRNIVEFNQGRERNRLAYIVCVIDELADLLLDKRKDDNEERGPSIGKIIESAISRLAQKARKTGMHIVAATQRPSVKLIQGDIKANFRARLSFKLTSQVDSRVVLDTNGAEHLLGQGDCLFLNPNRPGLTRVHTAWASKDDISAAVELANQRSLK